MSLSYGKFTEGNTFRIKFTIEDQDDVAFQPTTLKLSIYEYETKTIINARDEVTLTVGTYVTAGGVLTWDMEIADVQLADAGHRWERHVARFDITWSAGTRAASFEIPYLVMAESDI